MGSELSVEKRAEQALNTLPLGESNFHRLRADGQVYVDKTALIAELLRNKKSFILLTRPYLFGKTLLLSTIESLFKDGLSDFKGLAIETQWHEGTYPVIKLDLAECACFDDIEGFRALFLRCLKDAVGSVGLEFPKADADDQDFLSSRLKRLLAGVADGTKLVLLIDNYDAPLNNSFKDKELFCKVVAELNAFYSVLKQFSGLFRCIFITGVHKYKDLTSLAGSSFIKDISLYSRYSTLLGITDDELKLYLEPYVRRAANSLDCTFDRCLLEISHYFSWYSFDEEEQTSVYDPISILNFLDEPKRKIKSYWIDAVKQEPLVKYLLARHTLKDLNSYQGRHVLEREYLELGCDDSIKNEVAFMRSAGILSLKDADPNDTSYILYFSSHEVALFMARFYSKQVFGNDYETKVGDSAHWLFNTGSSDEIYEGLKLLFGNMDHKRYPITNEETLYSAFKLYLASGDIEPEDSTWFRDSDLEIKTDHRYYAIKLLLCKNWGDGEKVICDVIDSIHEYCIGELDNEEDFCSKYTFIRLVLLYSEEKQQFIDYFTRSSPRLLRW